MQFIASSYSLPFIVWTVAKLNECVGVMCIKDANLFMLKDKNCGFIQRCLLLGVGNKKIGGNSGVNHKALTAYVMFLR